MTRLGMLIDLRTCIGCHACSVACKAEFEVPLGVFRDTVKYVEEGKYPKATRHFIPVLCNQCEEAPCLKACPTGAIIRIENGEIVINKGDCNVNRFCMAACPYGAIYIDPEEHVAQKCTFCEHRTTQGMQPACVDACPTRCRIFGDLDDPSSTIAQKVQDNTTTVWKPEAGTKPRVLYIDPREGLKHLANEGIQVDTHAQMEAKGQAVGKTINPLPIYDPIPDHQRGLSPDQLIMISFKWNVHNAHRTMQSKWLQEIVHSNPAWLNPVTAARFGVQEGDWIELTSFRPKDAQVPHDDGSVVGTLRTRVHLTEGVHPLVIAVSHNNGRWVGGPIAARGGDRGGAAGFNMAQDPDSGRIWWQAALSVAQNKLIPIYPDPRSGQQAWHDTVVRLRKVTA